MVLSYKILSVLGIDIELHWSFIIFIVAIFLLQPVFALLLLIVFFFVTVHELSHSIVAMRNNIKVRRILLLPIGGMAMIDVSEMKPITEIKMAIAGPLFNFAMAILLLGLAFLLNFPLLDWASSFISDPGNFSLPFVEMILFYSFYANILLGTFNLLIPAFPLDGGRIFRAALALKLDYLRATNIAKTLSFIIAGLLFVLAVYFGDLWIMIIAFFIGFGAMAEYQSLLMHTMLKRIKVRDLISEDYMVVSSNDPLHYVVEDMIMEKKLTTLVKGKTLKVLDLKEVSSIPRSKWKNIKAKDVAKEVKPVTIRTTPENILQRMLEDNRDMIPVFERNKLIGVVFREDIEKMIRIVKILGK